MKRHFSLTITLFTLLLLAGCGSNTAEEPAAEEPAGPLTITLTSPAFGDGEAIPEQYTCDGDDVSPPLAWAGAPAGTASFALIMDDPDAPAGTWVHWVVYDLPAHTTELAEGIPAGETLPGGGVHGQNSWQRTDYGGPCPPAGTHRYFFKLYALDVRLNLDPGAGKDAVLNALDGHVLAQGQLMGTYQR